MKRIIRFAVVVLVVALVVAWFVRKPRLQAPHQNGLTIATSFYPLYFIASEVAGERALVYNFTPAGAEPHDYDLTTQDRVKLENSDLIILNGVNLEPWGKNLEKVLPGKPILRVGELFGDGTDPHVWLDPTIYIKIVEIVTSELIRIDPAGTNIYRANSSNLISGLYALHESFQRGLAVCDRQEIITAHEAFSYLAQRYGFKQISIAGLSPDAEPSPRDLVEVAKLAREKEIKYIFFESLVSPKLANTVASEVGAETLVLNPLEGLSEEELQSGKNYLTEMMANLNNLKTALVCH